VMALFSVFRQSEKKPGIFGCLSDVPRQGFDIIVDGCCFSM
jgi:hypothetical protein